MILGVPVSELLLLAALIIVGGFVTGILAGLFGIGGGALIVPVLYEVFRALGVPDEVRFQLCVGTSIAIIVPTNVLSFLTHRDKGAVMMDVVRAWAPPAVIGVAVGSAIAAFAPAAVLKLAFVLVGSVIAIKLLVGRDSWRLADDLPGRGGMTAYGFFVGLAASLMGISGGSISNMILTLHGKSDAQRGRDLGRAWRADHDRRHHRLYPCRPAAAVADAAAVARLRLADRLCADGAGVELHRALWRAPGARAVEASARGRFRVLPADRLRALCREPDRMMVTDSRA